MTGIEANVPYFPKFVCKLPVQIIPQQRKQAMI